MAHRIRYTQPIDGDVLACYITKQAYRKSDARKIKRALRKLTFNL